MNLDEGMQEICRHCSGGEGVRYLGSEAILIVSEGGGCELTLYDNTWTVPEKSDTLPNFMSNPSSAKFCYFF